MRAPMEARHLSQSSPRRSLAYRDTWRAFKRWLYWFHRWLGVVTCLFCVMWFLTGLVMLYVPFPSWSDAERIASLPPVAIEKVRALPDDALAASGIAAMPSTFRLEMQADEPVYRIVAGDKRATISAVTGAPLTAVSPEAARRHLATVFPANGATLLETLDYDQWTPVKRFDPHRPLHRFALDDEAGTTIYVSSQTGEIVQNTTRSERVWNWLGAIPHWIYFAPIRRDQELWRQAVMWLSGPLVIGAISGLWIGILRLRPAAAKARRSVSPYRGWMKWHHVGGLIGGLFLCTWIFSGRLSVNPFQWFARTQINPEQIVAFSGWSPEKHLDVSAGALAVARGASDISFTWADGKPLMLARSASGTRMLHASSGNPTALPDEALIAAASRMYPSNTIVAAQRLTQETLYWYSHNGTRLLPAIEIRFDDPAQTSIYIDPQTASVAGLTDTSSRTYRWLFRFLHDYDLPVLLRNQPARDVLIWLLSLAGLVISVSGVVVGWRTLRRSVG